MKTGSGLCELCQSVGIPDLRVCEQHTHTYTHTPHTHHVTLRPPKPVLRSSREAPEPVDRGLAPCKQAPTSVWKQITYFTSGPRMVSDSGSSTAWTSGNLLVTQETNVTSWGFPQNKDQHWYKGEFKASATTAFTFLKVFFSGPAIRVSKGLWAPHDTPLPHGLGLPAGRQSAFHRHPLLWHMNTRGGLINWEWC